MQALKTIAVWFTLGFSAAILLCHTDIIYTLVKKIRDFKHIYLLLPYDSLD